MYVPMWLLLVLFVFALASRSGQELVSDVLALVWWLLRVLCSWPMHSMVAAGTAGAWLLSEPPDHEPWGTLALWVGGAWCARRAWRFRRAQREAAFWAEVGPTLPEVALSNSERDAIRLRLLQEGVLESAAQYAARLAEEERKQRQQVLREIGRKMGLHKDLVRGAVLSHNEAVEKRNRGIGFDW